MLQSQPRVNTSKEQHSSPEASVRPTRRVLTWVCAFAFSTDPAVCEKGEAAFQLVAGAVRHSSTRHSRRRAVAAATTGRRCGQGRRPMRCAGWGRQPVSGAGVQTSLWMLSGSVCAVRQRRRRRRCRDVTAWCVGSRLRPVYLTQAGEASLPQREATEEVSETADPSCQTQGWIKQGPSQQPVLNHPN
jgi:hypothetical protein